MEPRLRAEVSHLEIVEGRLRPPSWRRLVFAPSGAMSTSSPPLPLAPSNRGRSQASAHIYGPGNAPVDYRAKRTEPECRDLFAKAGFEVTQIVPTAMPKSVTREAVSRAALTSRNVRLHFPQEAGRYPTGRTVTIRLSAHGRPEVANCNQPLESAAKIGGRDGSSFPS